MTKPLYTHDCDLCSFLGSYQEHDLYYCAPSGVIARHGDEGSLYVSMDIRLLANIVTVREYGRPSPSHEALREAVDRVAIRRYGVDVLEPGPEVNTWVSTPARRWLTMRSALELVEALGADGPTIRIRDLVVNAELDLVQASAEVREAAP
jgi:hypothetical protein